MNLDQYLMVDYIRRFGAGEYVRAGVAKPELITQLIRRMIESAQYKICAALLRNQIFRCRTGDRFQACIDGILCTGPLVPSDRHPTISI
jgi:UDP:flavonoid glycosyltransferase YjiC (YdhE family)